MSDGTATADEGGLAGVRPVASRLADLAPQAGIGLCFLATVLGGMALADEAAAANLAVFHDPGHVGNVGVFALYVLVGTVAMLLAFRYGRGETLLRVFMVGLFGAMAANALLLATGIGGIVEATSVLGGLPATPVGIGIAAVGATALWFYPEWYVVDALGILAGAAIIPMLGLGFGPLPIVVLLVVWAAYDAYAVYGSGHMKELASGVGTLKVPVVFVVPRERGASFREGGFPDIAEDSDEHSDDAAASPPMALLGLGDAIIPGMLAVSAGQFIEAPSVVPALNANAPALGALLGGIAGMFALVYILHRFEGAHAGLPPLNAGVLAGYFVGTVAAELPLAAAVGL